MRNLYLGIVAIGSMLWCLHGHALDWREGVMEDTTVVLDRLEEFSDLLWDGEGEPCPVSHQVIAVHQDLSEFFYGVSGGWSYPVSRTEFRAVCHTVSQLTQLVGGSCKPVHKAPLKQSWNGVVHAYRRLHSWFQCAKTVGTF